MDEVPKWMTIPAELEFKTSEAENTKIGVWSKCVIDKDEKYGPFAGEKKKLSAVLDDTYSWEIRGPRGRRLFSIDASDPSKGNWMRYVKSARYYEEQNMIAVQEGKNIFYKTLRMIPKGEELLCWYKGDKPLSKDEVMSSTKVEDSKNGITNNGDSVKSSNSLKTDSKDKTNCPEGKTDESKMISVTAGGSSSKDASVQGACIRLTGLTDSIQRMITTTFSDIEIRSREPVVRLVPLSAEIKQKVHLDLDIHLDSELKTKLESRKEEKTEKTETRVSEFHPVKSKKSSDFEANAVVTYGCVPDCSKQSSLSSLPVSSIKDENDTIISKENRECKSGMSTCSQMVKNNETIETSVAKTVVKSNPSEPESVLKAGLNLCENETKPCASESVSALNSNLNISHNEVKVDPNLPESNVKTEPQDSKSELKFSPSSSLTTETTVQVGTSSSASTDKSEPKVSGNLVKSNVDIGDTSSSNAIRACDAINVSDEFEKNDPSLPENTATNGASSSDTTVEFSTCPTGTDEKPKSESKLLEQIAVEKIEEMEKPMCLRSEETTDVISQELSHSGDPSEGENEEVNKCDVAAENETSCKMEINAEERCPDADNKVGANPPDAIDQTKPPTETSVAVPGTNSKFPMTKKGKKFRCQQCGREFRKPFQLKMHIIKAHEKRERKFRGYKISKRETIRTRSVSYIETAMNEAVEKSPSPEPIVSKAVNDQQQSVTSREVQGNSKSENNTMKFESTPAPTPAPDMTSNPNTTPTTGDCSSRSADTSKVKNEIFEYVRCQQTFQYQSWLNRHMVVHEKNDSLERNPTVQNAQNAEKKLTQESVEVSPKPNDQPRKSNFLSEFHVPKFKQLNFSEEQSKPFSCEVYGKMFTTKKNTRRHKRLKHNILVRPDRTKLHYANYTVEKSDRGPTQDSQADPRTVKEVHKKCQHDNRSKFGSKALSLKGADHKSADISVHLFNPSQLRLPEQPTIPQTKIQWRVASTRTGPPPAVANIEVDELYRMNITQEAKFTGVGISNPWVGVSKPKPYIPKRRKTERSKSPGYAKEKKHGSINMSKKISALSSSTSIGIKEEPTTSSNAAGNIARKSLASTAQTPLEIAVTSMKRKLQESDVEKRDHPRAIAPKRNEQDMFPKSPFKASVSLDHASSPLQVQPLASNVNIPKLLSQSAKLQLGRQPQSVSTASILELEARIRTLQSELAGCEGAIPQRANKADKVAAPTLPKYACNVCLVNFGSTFALNQHVSIHADSWPYKCELCVQLFQTPRDLMQHGKTHHANKIELQEQHKEDLHSSKTNEKPTTESSQPAVQTCTSYTCTKCSKQFFETSAFHGHIIDCASNGTHV